MPAPRHNANGHRRRELVRRVKAEETHCALCGEWVDPHLKYLPLHGPKCPGGDQCPGGCIPHPRRGEVDEDIPRARGGSPYHRTNCHLMHRACNQFKSDSTLTEAIKRWNDKRPNGPGIQASPIW